MKESKVVGRIFCHILLIFILMCIHPFLSTIYIFYMIADLAKMTSPQTQNITPNDEIKTALERGILYDVNNPYKEVDSLYLNSEEVILENIINKEMQNIEFPANASIPFIEKRKIIITIIFAILTFASVSLIFFHMPWYTLLIELLFIILYKTFLEKYNTVSYLKKQIKSRPTTNISDIISSTLREKITDTKKYKKICILIIVFACLLPLLIFMSPHIMYEKCEGGYAVRFYTIGLTNFTTIEIPEQYKGEDVVEIRGNVFAHIPTLKEITLPDTIKSIRGRAFKDDINLEKIDLPVNLEYLGGGAFKNCSKLISITIPKGVTEINGETFVNCKSLVEVKLHDGITNIHGETFINCHSLSSITLPPNITEIRGNTFENCYSLKEIDIPEGVTRIGGHAFYGCSSLARVSFPSTLKEIGSSAFRQCTSLNSVVLPKGVNVNEKAFKESPTKVRYEGELDYGNIIDKTKYKHNRFTFLKIDDVEDINVSFSDAIAKGTITLISVTTTSQNTTFTLKYTDNTGDLIFNLNNEIPYKEINENIALEISDDYVFSRKDSISLNIYYN